MKRELPPAVRAAIAQARAYLAAARARRDAPSQTGAPK